MDCLKILLATCIAMLKIMCGHVHQQEIDKIIIKNGKYYVENITQSNNIFQQVHKIFTSKKNTHWILTADGIIKLEADSFKENKYSPQLLFHKLK